MTIELFGDVCENKLIPFSSNLRILVYSLSVANQLTRLGSRDRTPADIDVNASSKWLGGFLLRIQLTTSSSSIKEMKNGVAWKGNCRKEILLHSVCNAPTFPQPFQKWEVQSDSSWKEKVYTFIFSQQINLIISDVY